MSAQLFDTKRSSLRLPGRAFGLIGSIIIIAEQEIALGGGYTIGSNVAAGAIRK
jgi:hypothetical protein